MAEEAQTGTEAIDEIAKAPNLDRFFDINPKRLSDADLRELIAGERQARALFIEKKGK